MRTLLLSTAACLAVSALTAQTTVLSEDFQQGLPASWTIVIQDSYTVDPSVSEFAPGWIALQDPDNSLDTIVGATSYFTTQGLADRWLISPPLTLGAYGNFLTWQARSHDPSYPDDYHVLVSTTDANPASFTDTLKSVPSESEFWTTHTIDLSDTTFNLDNQTVYVAFVLRSFDKFKLYVDDFLVTRDDPVGIEEQVATSIIVYPNPATDELLISGNPEKVSIFNTAGALITETVMNGTSKLDISSLTSGTYLLTIFTAEGIIHKRIIKK